MTPASCCRQLSILNICSNSKQPVSKDYCNFSPAKIFMEGLLRKQAPTEFSPESSFAISPLFLYDTKGLSIFDDITCISEYYLSNAEKIVLKKYASRIAAMIPDNARIVELGAGSMAKTAILLEEIMKNFKERKDKLKECGLRGSDTCDNVRFPVYQPVDICASSLEISLKDLSSVVPEMQLEGLCGSYHDAITYLRRENLISVQNTTPRRPLVILWLGSSIGNMKREEAADFINHFRSSVFMPGDIWITGIDGRNWNNERAWKAYNDKLGVTKDFILNGLVNINRILVGSFQDLGKQNIATDYRTYPFPVDKFEYVGIYNEIEGRHEAYLEASEDMTISFQFDTLNFDNFLFQEWISSPLSTNTWIGDYLDMEGAISANGASVYENSSCHSEVEATPIKELQPSDNVCFNTSLKAGEKIHMEYSYKYSVEEISNLFEEVHMSILEHFVYPAEPYHVIISQEMPFWFQWPQKQAIAPKISPTLGEWEELWNAWDFITELIKSSDLLYQPIHLRHPLLFYLGHIPAFLDHHLLTNMNSDLEQSASLPKRDVPSTINTDNFLRGIDPDLDDPSRCHEHSELPNTWPSLAALNSFKNNVRSRVRALLRAADISVARHIQIPYRIRKALWMSFEHEAMHLETLLYMLLQCPPGMLKRLPIQRGWIEHRMYHQKSKAPLLTIPGGKVILGRSRGANSKNGDEDSDWGWDNEYPAVQVHVQSFHMQCWSVTVGDYVNFLLALNDVCDSIFQDLVPISWLRVVEVPESIHFNLNHYAVRTIFGPVKLREAYYWPVQVNGLQAEKYATHYGCRLPTEAEWMLAKEMSIPEQGLVHQQVLEARRLRPFEPIPVHHSAKNTGFKTWCPSDAGSTVVSATCSVYDMVGSGWEWTCTRFGPLTDHLLLNGECKEKFVPQEGYPEYSSDFFDGKHWVLLGGSWATHPRLSGRSTFRNWYQPGYGYVFAKFRCVKDISESKGT